MGVGDLFGDRRVAPVRLRSADGRRTPLALEEEIVVALVVSADIAPLDMDPTVTSAGVTGTMVTLESGTSGWA